MNSNGKYPAFYIVHQSPSLTPMVATPSLVWKSESPVVHLLQGYSNASQGDVSKNLGDAMVFFFNECWSLNTAHPFPS